MRAVNESFALPWVLETEMIFPLTLPMYNYYKYQRQIRHAGYNYTPTENNNNWVYRLIH